MFARIVILAIGYICGCFLTADVIAHAVAGKSIFEMGSGNPGMVNVYNELGLKAALITLLGDILKTVIAVALARLFYPQFGVIATAWAGLGSTLGHVFPIWHGFKGGKGVTCISSVVILMNPLLGCITGVVAGLAIVLSGYLSAGAVIAMAFYTVAAFFVLPWECACVSLVFLALTLYAHWSKLLGIRDGSTPQAGLAKKVRGMIGGKKG